MNLERLIDNIPAMAVDAVCVSQRCVGETGFRVAWVNNAFCEMFAIRSDAAIGLDPFTLLHWDYVEDFKSAAAEMRTAGKTSFMQDTLCLRADQSSFWGGVSFVSVPEADDGNEYSITFVRDIDELKNREQSAELALIENEHLLGKIEAVQARLMSAIKMSPDPFCIYDARDRLVIWNPAFAETISLDPEALKAGLKKKAIIEMCLENGFIDEAVGREEEYLEEYMDAWRRGETLSPITRIQGRDYKMVRARSPNGDHVVLCVDISEQLRQQRELETYAERLEEANVEISQQAMHDELTGLGNRRYLNAKLDELIKARARTGLEIAALHIDLDRFKQINDTMGHAAGDHVLKRVSEILRTHVRSDDVVARIGGDEFIVLVLCAADSNHPEIVADRLIAEICKPIPFEDRPCRLGASVGIARTPMIPAEELLTCSDIALYKAKSGGRAMKAVFDNADLETLRSSKRLADDILRGLDEDEFFPLYQPLVDMRSGDTIGLEVLAFWQHPDKGLLSAKEFLPTAAEIHADGRIEARLFSKAVRECHDHFGVADRVPSLGFNVCQTRLMDASLLEDLSDVQYHGRIAFELRESSFLEEENASVFERLDALRTLGVSLVVDDFGSGRASIVGLRRIAPEFLKIDARLVQPMTTSGSALRLVSSIVEIGRALEIGVIAQGVSTYEHAVSLQNIGCVSGQGTYFAQPDVLTEALARPNASDPPQVA